MENIIYEKCVKSFEIICAYSYATLGFGIIILILNIFAFIKMSIFYHKLNFENTLLLISSIQSIVLISQMMINLPILSLFIFLQIWLIYRINIKYHKISLGHIQLKSRELNYIIIILNNLYIPVFYLLYYFFEQEGKYNQFYFNIFYYILQICTSIFLTYHCCKFLRWISKNKSKDIGNVLFYSIKKRQFSFLPIANIIFSTLEFIIDILIYLNYNFNFIKANIIIYRPIILFVFFLHNTVVFFTFYWMVRVQYSLKIKRIDKNDSKKDIEKIIDNEFITDYASSGNENVEKFIYDEKNNIKASNTFDSFEIISMDEEKKEKENNIRRDSRSSNFDDEELINEKDNK